MSRKTTKVMALELQLNPQTAKLAAELQVALKNDNPDLNETTLIGTCVGDILKELNHSTGDLFELIEDTKADAILGERGKELAMEIVAGQEKVLAVLVAIMATQVGVDLSESKSQVIDTVGFSSPPGGTTLH